MRMINSVALAYILLAGLTQAAFAMRPTASATADSKRIALLIGNENYTAKVGPLANPGNDIHLVASALKQIGFSRDNIQIVTNANRIATLQAIDEYAKKLLPKGKELLHSTTPLVMAQRANKIGATTLSRQR